jgi:hypothetical protein
MHLSDNVLAIDELLGRLKIFLLNVESVSIMGKQRFWKGGKGYYDSNAHQ